MTLVEINRDDYLVEVSDGLSTYLKDLLPVDEWECVECHSFIGWTIDPNGNGLSWSNAYVESGTDPLTDDTPFRCSDCAGQ